MVRECIVMAGVRDDYACALEGKIAVLIFFPLPI